MLVVTCTEPPDDARVVLVEDLSKLASRVNYLNEEVVIDTSIQDTSALGKTAVKPIQLELIAEVEPPVIDGQTLQATDVHILSSSRVYVSYNMAGELYLGAVDLFDVSDRDEPELKASLLFNDSDVNGMARYNNDLYLAIATDRDEFESPAAIEIVDATQKDLTLTSKTIDLPSWSATHVSISDKHAFITSGAEGGFVTVLDVNDHATAFSYPIEDARWVDDDGEEIAVLAGTPATVYTFDYDAGTFLNEIALSGANIPHSKSTIQVYKRKAVIAAGDGGTQVVCLATGALIEKIDPPTVDGLSPDVTVANAATSDGKYLYMSNGEAGVYVGWSKDKFDSKNCDVDDFQMIGSFRFGDLESVNHVGIHGDWLYVAGGSGGLKILKVTQ